MKLAEALIERADLQKKIAQIAMRMGENAQVQEGDEPAEDVEKLLPIYEDIANSLEKLIIRINKTNSVTPFEEITLSDAIAKRDCLKSKLGVYQGLRDAASASERRYSRSEIRFIRCVDMSKLLSIIDDLSKKYRELDTKIQGLNWTVDLV